ncbi:hypothetical protein SAMN04489713_104397 [Actinomadura madurae]|uniref:DUF3592 domain-containing protein n=1 Tax=Actinomadura madurae TaxID=1993 RepID=A0A1I5F2D6_9ACTN|nr:hypothetical protein SAMN04489713_104397 [Actinomadura madurae]
MRTAEGKNWSWVSAGWVGLPLVLLLLLVTEDTAGWWRWPVAAAGLGFFVCAAIGLVRLDARRRGGGGTAMIVLALVAGFPFLILLGNITPARAERVESCRVSALKPTNELWLRQDYRVACPAGTRDVVHRPSPRANKADRDRPRYAVGETVWVSISKDDPDEIRFVTGPGSGRLALALIVLAIVGVLSAVGIWRALTAPKRPVP